MAALDDLEISPGERVLVRADLNVPLDAGAITDDLRIRAVLPTVNELLDRDAAVILMSHLGRPGGEVVAELSLAPVAEHLSGLLGRPVAQLPGITGDKVEQMCSQLEAGQVALLENLRFDKRETGNDAGFAAEVAALADAYVNDAFGSSHREHASVDAVPRLLPHAPGLLLEAEISALGRLLDDPPRPFVGILGGAKVSDKLGAIDALLERVDKLLIGGAMMFTFSKAQGGSVGASLVEDDRIPDVETALGRAAEIGKEIVLPSDTVVAQEISSDAQTRVVSPGDIDDGWLGLDIGPETAKTFAQEIAAAGSALWNGPMGVFETPPFDAGTRAVAEAFAAAPGFTVAGGGDSAAALRQMGLAGSIDHLSTGGGASLEYIERGDLPGLAALRT